MAELIESAKNRHGAPGTIAAKTGSSQVADYSRKLGQRQGGGMDLQAVHPRCSQFLDVFQPPHRIPHRVHGHVLVVLIFHVLAVGSLERFFPVLPFGMRQIGVSADHFGKDFFFSGIGILPIQLMRQMQPLISVEQAVLLQQSSVLGNVSSRIPDKGVANPRTIDLSIYHYEVEAFVESLAGPGRLLEFMV